MRPFFAFPLESLSTGIQNAEIAVRSLPDPQLAVEIEQLREVSRSGSIGDPRAQNLLRAIYENEASRRGDPAQRHDEELDAALDRLERQTTAEDRALVESIGAIIVAAGGVGALRAAYARMVERGRAAKRDVRSSILSKRWAHLTSAKSPIGG